MRPAAKLSSPPNPSETVEICERIARDVREQYTIGYSSMNGKPGAYHKIRVTARSKEHGKLSVRTRAGYIAGGDITARQGREMRVAVPKKSLKKLLRWSQRGLFACAVAMLGYCAFVVVDTRVFQERESRTFQRLLEDQHATGGDSPQAKLLSPPKIPPASAMSGLIGRIEIARLGLSVMVIEGDDGKTLRRAAGHVPGTALPGQPGNVGITRAPRYILPAAAKYPDGRCDYAHHVARRVSLPRGVHEGRKSTRR